MAATVARARACVADRLRERRAELEQATMTRVFALSEPSARTDPEYAHGLRAAVAAGLDYGLEVLERGEERAPPIPPILLAQARLAARGDVSLDTVLRRYLAGYTLLGDYVVQEAEQAGLLGDAALQQVLRTQAAVLDRLLAAVGEEYSREQQGRLGSAEQRRADRVKRLLQGELLDTTELGYEIGDHHLGLIASGAGMAEAIRDLAVATDRRLLLVRREEGTVWAWLGSRRGFDRDQVEGLIVHGWPPGASLAVGEPGKDLDGWQLTHRQARAALPIALRPGEIAVRYGDVALLASMLRDDLLIASLRNLYIAPLEAERDGGTTMLQTLRAYYEARRNISSAAAAMNVSRQTLRVRLRTAEERLGKTLESCDLELEMALRLESGFDRHSVDRSG